LSGQPQQGVDGLNVKVLKTEMTQTGHIMMTVESTLGGTRCRRCGQEIGSFTAMTGHCGCALGRFWSTGCISRPAPSATAVRTLPHPQRCRGYEPTSLPTRAFEPQALRSNLIHTTVTAVSRQRGLSAEAVQGRLDRQGARAVDGEPFMALRGEGAGRDGPHPGPPGLGHDRECSDTGRGPGRPGGIARSAAKRR
jgi:hypothetical protein